MKKIRQHWKLSLIVFISLMLISSAIFKVLTPINYENTWENLNPGVSSATDLVTKLGEPDKITRGDNSQLYEYKNKDDVTFNTEIGISGNNEIISFIKERLKYDPTHTLKQYTDKYGQADLELYPSAHTGVVKAYVYLDEGIAVFAHQLDFSIEQKWYFLPTTKELFIKSWQNSLRTQLPGPEEFNP